MKFFKPKYSVCSECGVHFEPATGYEKRWGHFCQTHRKDVRMRDEKKDAAIQWATENWERVAQIMEEEKKAIREKYNQAQYNKNPAATMQAMPGNSLGTLAGLQQAGGSIIGSIFR